MAPESQRQSRSSSPSYQHTILLYVKHPKLMRAATTAPSLQTSICPKDAQYIHSSTRATVLLNRMVSSASIPRKIRKTRIKCVDSSYTTSHNQQSPSDYSDCSEGVDQKDDNNGQTTGYTENYFSFPNFEDFENYQEEG